MPHSVCKKRVASSMRSQRTGGSLENWLCLGAKMLVAAILCGGLVMGLVKAQYHGAPDDIVFPGETNANWRRTATGFPADGSDTPISLDLAFRLNSLNTSEEFLQLFDVQTRKSGPETYDTRRFGEADERSNALQPKPANCMPELQSVSLDLERSPSEIIFPACTRVKRCGGCCNHELLSCQPVETETQNFEVNVVTVVPQNTHSRRIVPLEVHNKCKCDCRIKEEHCNDKQRYEAPSCRCVCSNVDEQQKCYRDSNMKVWNPESCTCSCRQVHMCSTGYYFDNNTCRCQQILFSRPVNRFASTGGPNYNFASTRQENVPPVIIPLDPSDPRRKHKEDPEYD